MTANRLAQELLAGIEISRQDTDRRELLLRACSLFEATSDDLSEREAALFDDVLERLTRTVDETVRAESAERIAASSGNIPNTVRQLAFDNEITVAAPVLSRSDALKDEDLVEVARTRGQSHMVAIAERPALTATVTDTLVERGEQDVLRTVARNEGARFSGDGYTTLAQKSREDETLQAIISARQDVTPAVVHKLLTVASARVRSALLARGGAAEKLAGDDVIQAARRKLEQEMGMKSIDFIAADRRVRNMIRNRPVDEGLLRALAQQDMFGELIVAFGMLTNLPMEQAQQCMGDADALLIASKASDFDVETMKYLLGAGPVFGELATHARRDKLEEYKALRPETAQRVIRFWRMRQKVTAA
ncbi:MAG: DUF2336 domain-containing protein [Pseudomonadota bacterium]